MKKGTKLRTLEGDNTRPTLDRVKEALFSILMNKLVDAKVLDLFAGSGALGLESLSRGAESAVFVDKSPQSIKIIKENIVKTGFEDASKVYKVDFEVALKKLNDISEKFDIIYLDPPYGKNIVIKTLNCMHKYDILNEDGIIVAETDESDVVDDVVGNFFRYDERKYGRVRIHFFRKAR